MISVVVPIYNVEKYLNKAIESILNQSYKNLEIILVDDGSKDNCPKLCDEYAKIDNRVKVIHKKNGGLRSAIVEGVKVARGEYLGFVDSDDWVDTNMYEKMLQVMQEKQADIVCSGYKNVAENGEYVSSYVLNENEFVKGGNIDNLAQCVLSDNNIVNVGANRWSKLYKTEDVAKIIDTFSIEISMAEDLITNVLVFNNANKVVVMNDCFYNYRMNLNSISKEGLHWEKYLKAQVCLKEKLVNYEKHVKIDLCRWFVNVAKGSLVEIQLKINNKKEQITKQKEIINNNDLSEAINIIYPLDKGVKNKVFNFFIKRKNITIIRFLIKVNKLITTNNN